MEPASPQSLGKGLLRWRTTAVANRKGSTGPLVHAVALSIGRIHPPGMEEVVFLTLKGRSAVVVPLGDPTVFNATVSAFHWLLVSINVAGALLAATKKFRIIVRLHFRRQKHREHEESNSKRENSGPEVSVQGPVLDRFEQMNFLHIRLPF